MKTSKSHSEINWPLACCVFFPSVASGFSEGNEQQTIKFLSQNGANTFIKSYLNNLSTYSYRWSSYIHIYDFGPEKIFDTAMAHVEQNLKFGH